MRGSQLCSSLHSVQNQLLGPDENAKTYIASQGCLEATVNDFWQMVWEQGANVIAMVTAEEVRGMGALPSVPGGGSGRKMSFVLVTPLSCPPSGIVSLPILFSLTCLSFLSLFPYRFVLFSKDNLLLCPILIQLLTVFLESPCTTIKRANKQTKNNQTSVQPAHFCCAKQSNGLCIGV